MSNQETNKAATRELQEGALVTFALFAYNQEKYIREAVEGALAQTYSPLEIIFSDDCSSDRTFDAIKQTIKAYSGPHRILLNRNPINLGADGIGSHVNKVVEMASGELVVFAAGDDISMPGRGINVDGCLGQSGYTNRLHPQCSRIIGR